MNEANTNWTFGQRIGYRFLFAYLVLFFFPLPSGLVNPYWLGNLLNGFWGGFVPWFSRVFLNLQVAQTNNGSGDTTYDYVRVLSMLLLAGLVTVIWSVVDRRRGNYRKLNAWARIWLRYVLALCMLTYGAVKVLMVQFEPPAYGRLIQPLGNFSPMAFLWTFMGYSQLYTSFTGITEVIAGMLLFFRRTTTLGALLVVGIMTNVLMLNLAYDVPVKLGALHLILLAMVLIASDLRRLLNFFVLNRPAPAADLGPHFANKRSHQLSVALKTVLICSLLIYFSWDTFTTYRQNVARREIPPAAPEGSYRIVSIKKDSVKLPPLPLEEFRWRAFNWRDGIMSFRGVDGSSHRFKQDGDPTKGSVRLYPVSDKNELINDAPSVGTVRLNLADAGQAVLLGDIKGHLLEATLQRENPSDFPLMSRRFRWIIEEPYFR